MAMQEDRAREREAERYKTPVRHCRVVLVAHDPRWLIEHKKMVIANLAAPHLRRSRALPPDRER